MPDRLAFFVCTLERRATLRELFTSDMGCAGMGLFFSVGGFKIGPKFARLQE